MPNIQEASERFRRQLAKADVQARAELLREYAEVQRRLRRATQQVDYLVRRAVRNGQEPTYATLGRQSEYRRMTSEMNSVLLKAAGKTATTTDRVTRYALGLAQQEAAAQLDAAAVTVLPVTLIPQASLEQTVLNTRTGPLKALLVARAGEASDEVGRVLVRGMAEGWDARKVGARMAEVGNLEQHRALTIARTELMRASREGLREQLAANRTVTPAWRWDASLDDRCCGYCLAQHGTIHPVDKPMPAHPRCRCALVAVTSLTQPTVTGVDLFAAMTPAAQLHVLGPAKFAAFHDGALTLPDLIRERDHPQWGPSGSERSLRDIVGGVAAAGYIAQARAR